MKRIALFIVLFIALLTLPNRADALPLTWCGTPKFERRNITYRVHDGMHAAVVVKTRGKRVCIPAEIKYHGKWYEVRSIWRGSLKGAKSVTIHADLECCESGTLWKKGVRVYVTRKNMYRWLKRTGANVSRIHCDGCER